MSAWSFPLPFFSFGELECRCCSEIKLDIRLAAMLPALRLEWGKPLSPTSASRCTAHNNKVSQTKSSLHLIDNPKWDTDGCGAIDIYWEDWAAATKLEFARLAHKHGFRVGLHDTFIHLDIGRKLGISPTPFLYGQWSKPFEPEDVL